MDRTLFEERFESLLSHLDSDSANKITELLTTSYRSLPGVQSYKPAAIFKALEDIAVRQTTAISLHCQKTLLIGVILKNWHKLPDLAQLSVDKANQASIRVAYQHYLERVYNATDLNDQQSLCAADIFWKELAIARLQFFPISAGVVDFYSGFGFKQGLSRHLLQSLEFVFFTLKHGRKPYYRTHLHTPTLGSFSAQGWIESYLQIATMLTRDESIKGLVRTSWYFDPKIKIISPHLSYLQELPLQNGASLFCVGADDSGCALQKSSSRLALYNKGDYVPTNYLLIWPRSAIISWSNQYQRTIS